MSCPHWSTPLFGSSSRTRRERSEAGRKIRLHLATVRAMTTPGTQLGEVSSERLPMLRSVSLLGAPPAGLLEQDGWRPTLFQEMVADGTKISTEALHERQASVKPRDPVQIQYTSGTTGFPKGAILHHYGILNNAMLFARRWGLRQSDRYCNPMPFFHTAGSPFSREGDIGCGRALPALPHPQAV